MVNITLHSGTILNKRYRVIETIGQGGFGSLYRACDEILERDCVLKGNLDFSAEAERQFFREAKLLANLHHPNLPRVTDYFTSAGTGQYLVMDYIDGQDLQEMLDKKAAPVDEAQALTWIRQICDALSYLHRQKPSIIHRDIKPGNIKITPEDRAVLIDFGIAKEYFSQLKTTVGAQAVTPGFSPIEQYGKGKTDARSDLYALGATLYTLLTYQEPPESVQRVSHDPLVAPRKINTRVSKRIENAILKAMNLDPDQRFQTALQFKKAIDDPLEVKPSSAQISSTIASPSPASKIRSSPQSWLWLAAFFALILILFPMLLFSWNQRNQEAVEVTEITLLKKNTTTYTPENLIIPTKTVAIKASLAVPFITPVMYEVTEGDTCGELAADFEVSLQDIIAVNNLSYDCQISTGQKLLILQPQNLDYASAISPTLSITTTQQITRASPKDSMTIVYIPAGSFLMGSSSADPDASVDEQPQHWVYLDAFWIDQTEVTNEMYALCVRAGACRPPASYSSKKRFSYFNEDAYRQFPVIHVSWEAANKYCMWAGRRLPTEAEWEKAARGYEGLSYPWGNEAPTGNELNFDNQIGDTVRVGNYQKGKSPYGVLDMSGNVSEWVADFYLGDYYTQSPSSNPLGPLQSDFRVIRGGSWLSRANAVRTAFRLWNAPDLQTDVLGFRCALYAESP